MSDQTKLNDTTKQHIADALWLDSYNDSKIDKKTLAAIQSDKNSEHAMGERMRDYMEWLKQHQQSYNPDYTKRYTALRDAIYELTPQQAYVIGMKFLGSNSVQGYEPMPESADLQFPRDHAPKLRSQVGWHFFVGSAWDESGQEWGIELMFFRVALLPPELARQHGLSDIENQVVEIQLGISKAGERHHQADPIIVAGTTGLVEVKTDPLRYSVGKNTIESKKSGAFFPIGLQAQGVDRGDSEPFELGVDLEFVNGKETLLQGDGGCMPCIAGMGTLYYSIPNIELKPGSTINYGDKTIRLQKGTFWFDHQWGFLGGNPDSTVLRAANSISAPAPAGWDWYMAQFSDDRQLTMFAPHTKECMQYYFQTGDNPPGPMTVNVAGTYMDEHKAQHLARGQLVVDGWIKSTTSPNQALYPVTNTWYPNSWRFSFDHTLPEDIRNFSMAQIVPVAQTNVFANGSEYNEGAVYLTDPTGKDIGRGFAEAVQYADTTDNLFRLSGIGDNRELRRLVLKNVSSVAGRLRGLLYLSTHKAELKSVLASAKGMEFFGPPSSGQNVSQRHAK